MTSNLSVRFGLMILAGAWLVPNHYAPWTSFHGELVAAVGGLLVLWGFLAAKRRSIVPLPAILCGLAALVPLVQVASGEIFFFGDGFTASMYLVGLAAAIVVGRNVDADAVRALAWAMLGASIVSVGIALCQWLNIQGLSVLLVEMRPGARPYGNIAQANLLATSLVLGLAGATEHFERKRLSWVTFGVIAVYLTFGIVISQSRAAILELLIAATWLLVRSGRQEARIRRSHLIAFVFILGGMVALRGWAADVLLLAPGRVFGEQMSGGARLTYWPGLVKAIGHSPLLGYGWNQVSVAQMQTILEVGPSREMVEHSHDIILDLLIWNGVPLGALILGLIAWWLVRSLRHSYRNQAVVATMSVLALLTHALVEYPLDYAFFLLPFGFFVGTLDTSSHSENRASVSRLTLIPGAALLSVSVVIIASDYLKMEENHRLLRFQSARIGQARVSKEVPDVLVLTQLRAFLHFARSDAHRNMSRDELDQFRKVANRFGFPPVLYRYALALAMNGQGIEATRTLAKLCRVAQKDVCDESRDTWRQLGNGPIPELAAVPFPATQ